VTANYIHDSTIILNKRELGTSEVLIMVDNGHCRWLVFSSYKTDGLPPQLAREYNARLYFSTRCAIKF
jgi:hypothetical protein